jgi:pyridoxamine 5'-phosphate oxidase
MPGQDAAGGPDHALEPGARALGALRRDYPSGGLSEADLAPTWTEQFARWFAAASQLSEANAMIFATADERGRPSARTVLLKAFNDHGFVLFTNYTSRKGREAAANPYGSLVFPWYPLHRQVIVVGAVERLDAAESAAYFRSRPRGSRLGAWASRQSSVVASRSELTDRWDDLERRWPDDVPVPPFWGGLRVVPETVEFWHGRPDRLHDRLRYRRDAADPDRWVVERLAP